MERLLNYTEFLQEYIYKNFGLLDGDILRNDLGIDFDTYWNAIKNNGHLSKKNSKRVCSILQKIENLTDNKVLLRKLFGRVIFICDYGKVIEAENSFRGIYKDKNNDYSVEMYFGDDKISSYVRNNKDYSNIIFKKNKDGFVVKHDIKTHQSYGSSDNQLFTDITTKIVNCYDNNGKQFSQSKETIKEDYTINSETGDKELTSPWPFDNFTEKEFMWRDDDFLLKKRSEKHVFGDTDDDFINSRDGEWFFIGLDNNPDNMEITGSREFFGISDENYKFYVDGEISADELWEKTMSKYRNRAINFDIIY